MFYAAFLASILVPLSFAVAEDLHDSYGEGAGFGPWGVPYSSYHRLMDAPNATSSYALPGPNISTPYPASGPVAGWSWIVSVVADIAMSESNSSMARAHHNQTFTGSRVVLQTPTGPGISADTSWDTCVIQWGIDPDNYPAKFRADDGGCSSVLSEQCIRDLEAKAVEQYKSGVGGFSGCTCPSASDIASCNGEQSQIMKAGGGCMARLFNATTINDWPDGRFTTHRYGGPPHERGNLTAYNQTGSLTWPVLVVWGPSNRNTTTDGTKLVDFANTTAKMSCVRAKDAIQGGVAPGTIANNAGTRGIGLSVVVLFTAVSVVGAWAGLS